jgi:hypothetical protein
MGSNPQATTPRLPATAAICKPWATAPAVLKHQPAQRRRNSLRQQGHVRQRSGPRDAPKPHRGHIDARARVQINDAFAGRSTTPRRQSRTPSRTSTSASTKSASLKSASDSRSPEDFAHLGLIRGWARNREPSQSRVSPFSAGRRTLREVGRSVRWSQACLESFSCYSNSC